MGRKICLIINADDLNLTAGVTEAILDAHDHGLVTSSTILINLPLPVVRVRAIKQRKSLGIGLHLNVSLGEPVAPARTVRSLVTPSGEFRKNPDLKESLPQAADLLREWTAQILRFRKAFSRMPTHLDTHHHLHAEPFFFKALCELSRKYALPIRRSGLMNSANQKKYFKTADYFWGDLDPRNYWRFAKLDRCLNAMGEGLHEIMCHPGKNDEDLAGISSFTDARESEWKLFKSDKVRRELKRLGIVLTHYGLCYTRGT